jgi:hypothetical protein
VSDKGFGHRLQAVNTKLDPRTFSRGLSILTILLAVAISLVGCSSHRFKLPPRAKLLPPDRIHSKIRKFADLRENRTLAACHRLVFVGEDWPAPGSEPEELDKIVLADGPALYFDNLSGRKVADCSYWYCTHHNAECDAGCPPREWTCEGVDTGKPETEDERRRRAIGIIKTPSAREIRALEKRLVMPAGSDPVASYFRYYWAEPESGTRQIHGKFIARHLMPRLDTSGGNPGLGIDSPENVPKVNGVGCQLIQLKLDPRTRAVTEVRCSGS